MEASAALASLSSPKAKLLKAFSAIHTQSALLSACTTEWQELERYFADVEQALKQKFSQLSDREKEFESETKEAKAALEKRDASIDTREQASLARVQEQKASAIAALFEEKKKLHEERLNKVQDGGEASQLVGNAADVNSGNPTVAAPPNGPTSLVGAINQAKRDAEARVRPRLQSHCEKMDGDGLLKFIVNKHKDFEAIRHQLPNVLQCAEDSCRLVLKALDGYNITGRDEAGNVRRACIILLESLAEVVADPVLGVDYPVVPSDMKASAIAIAKHWRSKIEEDKNLLNTQAFLQLLATFGIASEFSDADLYKFVTRIARRKQTPALCRSLGLTAKMPDLVDKLVKDGKQMEALAFAHTFGLMERIQVVSLLNSYLKEACEVAQTLAKNAPNEAAGQEHATTKEVLALNAVINAIEEYNLGSQYAPENLQKRVAQLEKEKAERKRAYALFKQQTKKPRLRRAGLGSRVAGGVASSKTVAGGASDKHSTPAEGANSVSALDKGHYVPTDLGQYGGSMLSSYGMTSQVGYERRPDAAFGSAYGVGNKSPGTLSTSYRYPTTDLNGSSLFGSTTSYSDVSGSYHGYQFRSELSTSSSYPFSYRR